MKTRFKYDTKHQVWKLLMPIKCPHTGEVHWVSPGEVFTAGCKLYQKGNKHDD